jgi:hypothetical protein
VIPPINLTMKYFGKPPPTLCSYYLKLTGTNVVPVPSNGKPICATYIPGSPQAP